MTGGKQPASEPAPQIAARDLVKTYCLGGSVIGALQGISVEVARGEYLAVTGASGSGKSTFMNFIGALDTPTSGSLQVEGRELGGLSSDALAHYRNEKIGFVFQIFNLLARTSALDNVELPLLYRGLPRKERRTKALAALTSVGLPTKLGSTPGELSGGQQQRVAIARAIVTEPSTLFADEPTGNLDSVTTRDVMALLTRLNGDRGITVLVVTHNDEVAACARRTVLIRDGLIESDVRRA